MNQFERIRFFCGQPGATYAVVEKQERNLSRLRPAASQSPDNPFLAEDSPLHFGVQLKNIDPSKWTY